MKPISSLFRSLTKTFLAGAFAVLPLVITVAVVIWAAGFLGNFLGPKAVLGQLLRRLGLPLVSSEAFAYIVGWVVVLAVVFGLGVVVRMGAKQFLEDRMDAVARRMPLVGGVYGTIRQLVGMMDRSGSSDLKGMSVVFCVFGKDTAPAFLALLPTPECFRIGETDYHIVIIPSAPLPMGGSMLFVPVTAVRPANLTVDAFMSIYVSMGVSGPQFLKCQMASVRSPLPPGEG
jgi:uncharacterized membrane protein